MKIDFQFIKKWEPKYDEIESDQGKYLTLINNVSEDIQTHHSISIETFERIINWKSARIKGLIKWDQFDTYQSVFRLIINSQHVDKMSELVVLPGIGAPVASTILHFIFPGIYPIYDFRTVEVLHYFDYLKSKVVGPKHYLEFQKTMAKIRTSLVHYDLRQIDRALFSFHKLNPEKFKNYYKKRPFKCHYMKDSNSTDRNMREKKANLTIPEKVKTICEELGRDGEVIKRKDIIEKAKKIEINESSILPADYCDNTQTGQWSKYNFLHSIGRGKYILAKR
ncbi:MAG TPA: hypothetical protein VE912_07000 [Bacteroidales bacterium]|nr:hypothetical protein [Bacteroidales bacterium]